eukprot:556336-Prymnesium_polylepis.1
MSFGTVSKAFIHEDHVWLRSLHHGKEVFDIRIGSGGAISEMRACPEPPDEEYKHLLAPTWEEEEGKPHPQVETDRVVQTVWWHEDFCLDDDLHEHLRSFERRFNVNQTGTAARTGGIDQAVSTAHKSTPVHEVELSNVNGIGIVEVYATPQDQWLPELRDHIEGLFGHYTSYTFDARGALVVRKVIVVGNTYYEGKKQDSLNQSVIEQWVPFRSIRDEGPFTSFALHFSDSVPYWYYSRDNIPHYGDARGGSEGMNCRPVDTLSGYGVWYSDTGQGPAVALVFGKKQPVRASTTEHHGLMGLSTMYSKCGMYAMPCLHGMPPVQAGTVLDWSFSIMPSGEGLSADYLARLHELSEELPAPAWYLPGDQHGTFLATPLAGIVAKLKGYMGRRIDSLGALCTSV